MVPHLSQVGNVVYVFFGATVPFIIRSANLGKSIVTGKCQLVGEAYVRVMMDGQTLKMGYNEMDFTLTQLVNGIRYRFY